MIRASTSFILLILLWCLSGNAAYAQLPVERGIVWQVPANAEAVRTDLSRMRDAGVTAVRTGLIDEDHVLRWANAFGITLYQEVGPAYLTSARLADSREEIREMLSRALAAAHRYPVQSHFGVARYADTSVDATCTVIREFADLVRSAGPPGARPYYVSVFIEEDRCSDAVDFVLLNARDVQQPSRLVNRWRRVHDVPVGLAGVGTWTMPRGWQGLLNPRSLESQARFLETALTDLRDAALALEAVFVYRWRDAETRLPAFHRADHDPYRATYGLNNDDGSPRPSLTVASGFFTESQDAFAFERGDASYRAWPWTIILTWAVVLILSILYAFSARFRNTVPRYFLAHGFYRDAVREGRNLLLGSSFTMLLAISLATGVAASVVIDVLGQTTAFRILASWLPESLVRFWGAATVNPPVFMLLVAAIYAAIELFWIVILTLFSRTRSSLGPGQVMLLAVWPRWPLIALMVIIVALSVTTLPISPSLPLVIASALWIIVTLWAIARAVMDYTIISRVPPYVPLVVLLLHPFILLSIVMAVAALRYQDELEFLARIAGWQ